MSCVKQAPPGVQVPTNTLPAAKFVYVRNRSGGSLSAGAIVIYDATAANNAKGLEVPVTTTTSAQNGLVLGVIAHGSPDIANNGVGLCQVAGLHEGVTIATGTTAGHAVTTSTGAGVATAANTATDHYTRVGYLLESNTSGSNAKKKVFLTNPQGIA